MSQRLIAIKIPTLPPVMNTMLTTLARWQLRGKLLNISQIRGANHTLAVMLVMDGWIIQFEDGNLMLDISDIMTYGKFEQVGGCGCGK